MSLADRQNREQTYSKEYLLHQTPSRKDGIDIKQENQHRRKAQVFVKKLCDQVKLNEWVQQAALIYFERFFARRSFQRNDPLLVVAAALFLAAKATDNPRPIAAVAHAYFRVRNSNKQEEMASYNRNPERKVAELGLVDHLHIAERAILFTLDFNVRADLPFSSLTTPLYLEQFGIYNFSRDKKEDPDGPNAKQQANVAQTAVQFTNDSCRTNLVLQYTPQQAAAICLRYAAFKTNMQLKTPHIISQALIDAMPNNTEAEKKARAKAQEQRNTLVKYQITDEQYNDYVEQLNEAMYEKVPAPGAAADGAAAAAAPTAPAAQQQQQNGVAAPASSSASAGPRAAAAAQQQPQRPAAAAAAAAAGHAAPATTAAAAAAGGGPAPYPVPLPRPTSLPPRGADAQQPQPSSSYQTSTHSSGQQGSLLSKHSSAAEEGEITAAAAAAASDASEEVAGGRPPQPAVGGQHNGQHHATPQPASAPAPHPRVGPSLLNPVAQVDRSPRVHGTKRSAEPADMDSARDAKCLRVA